MHRVNTQASRRRYTSLTLFLAACTLYLIPTLYLLWPALVSFGRAIPGGDIAATDGWQNVWNLWWVGYAVSHGSNPFYTPFLFHPTGAPLYLQTLNITNGLLTYPVQVAAGPIAAYTITVVLGLVLTGWCTYLFAQHLLHRRGVALLVGALFTFTPLHLTKLVDGQLEWVSLQWLPLYVLCLHCMFEQYQLRWACAAGVSFVLLALTSWYCALYALLWTGILILLELSAMLRRGRARRFSLAMLMLTSIVGFCLLPLIVLGLRSFDPQPHWDQQAFSRSADVLDVLLPSHLHPWWGAGVSTWNQRIRPDIAGVTITPTISVLCLAALGGWAGWPRTRTWITGSAVFFVLALGPHLRIAGRDTGIVLPYTLLQAVPGMTLARRPNHFFVMTLLFLALLAGFGVRFLWERGFRARCVLGLFLGLVLLEYAVVPVGRVPFTSHPVYAALASQSGAVLDVPITLDLATTMRHQMVHGRPIIDGYLARTPPIEVADSAPGLRDFWNLGADGTVDDVVPDAHGLAALNYYAIRTIVIRHADLSPAENAQVHHVLNRLLPTSTPRYYDGVVSVYEVPRAPAPRPFVYLGDGWYGLEQDPQQRWRWMQGAASLRLVNPTEHDETVTLELAVGSYQQARPLTISLAHHPLLHTVVGPEPRLLLLALRLPPGEHVLDLQSTATQTPDQRHVGLQLFSIDLRPSP